MIFRHPGVPNAQNRTESSLRRIDTGDGQTFSRPRIHSVRTLSRAGTAHDGPGLPARPLLDPDHTPADSGPGRQVCVRPKRTNGPSPDAGRRRSPHLRAVRMVVDQPASIGAVPLAVARDMGWPVAYLPGLTMRRIADLYPGEAKTDARLPSSSRTRPVSCHIRSAPPTSRTRPSPTWR